MDIPLSLDTYFVSTGIHHEGSGTSSIISGMTNTDTKSGYDDHNNNNNYNTALSSSSRFRSTRSRRHRGAAKKRLEEARNIENPKRGFHDSFRVATNNTSNIWNPEDGFIGEDGRLPVLNSNMKKDNNEVTVINSKKNEIMNIASPADDASLYLNNKKEQLIDEELISTVSGKFDKIQKEKEPVVLVQTQASIEVKPHVADNNRQSTETTNHLRPPRSVNRNKKKNDALLAFIEKSEKSDKTQSRPQSVDRSTLGSDQAVASNMSSSNASSQSNNDEISASSVGLCVTPSFENQIVIPETFTNTNNTEPNICQISEDPSSLNSLKKSETNVNNQQLQQTPPSRYLQIEDNGSVRSEYEKSNSSKHTIEKKKSMSHKQPPVGNHLLIDISKKPETVIEENENEDSFDEYNKDTTSLLTLPRSLRRRPVVTNPLFRQCKHVPLDSKVVKEKISEDERKLFVPYDFGEVHCISDDEVDDSTSERRISNSGSRVTTSNLINISDVNDMVNDLIESSRDDEGNKIIDDEYQQHPIHNDVASVVSCSSSVNTNRTLPTTRVPKLAMSKRDTLSLIDDPRVEWDESSAYTNQSIAKETKVTNVSAHYYNDTVANVSDDEDEMYEYQNNQSFQSSATDEQESSEEETLSERAHHDQIVGRSVPLQVDGDSGVKDRVMQWESWENQMSSRFTSATTAATTGGDLAKDEWKSFLEKKVRDVSAAAAAVIAKEEESRKKQEDQREEWYGVYDVPPSREEFHAMDQAAGRREIHKVQYDSDKYVSTHASSKPYEVQKLVPPSHLSFKRRNF